MVKTTVYLDNDTLLSLRALAERKGRPQAELIREAVADYTEKNRPPLPAGIGMFSSGRADTATRRKEILREAARSRKWRS